MTDKILYIDLETSKNKKVLDVGALMGGLEYHGKDLKKILPWINEATHICGHNMIAHDLPILKDQLGAEAFKSKKIIDTLLWSPLVFADNPHHALVKGYQLVNEAELSNPLSDCKLCRELLRDIWAAYKKLPDLLKHCFYQLLFDEAAYRPFLEIAGAKNIQTSVLDSVAAICKTNTCAKKNLQTYICNEPVDLCYALAIILSKNPDLIVSEWVLHHKPGVQRILKELRFTNCGIADCEYCSEKLNPQKALSTFFGYPAFRSFDTNETTSIQERAVMLGLSDKSFVAVFPTGGGKSLTFQLPALMSGDLSRQLTVIISPLVSLMKDQVDNLEKKFGITRAVAVNGLLSPLERQEALAQVGDGRASLLYISPESLRSKTILKLLTSRSVARFVIDEAHCFSAWGHDFRVDYLYIAEFIGLLQDKCGIKIPVSCFTATAKPQVIEDIKNYFQSSLKVSLDELVSRASRKNLQYEVIGIENIEHKHKELIQLLHRCEKPAIVYASRTKKVEELANMIHKAGLKGTYFHGKLRSDEKVKNQNEFMGGSVDIIVATSAFGMGVDKEDVRTVVHFDISDSLENYTQEAGRAGRKENIEAKCYILFQEEDLNKHFSLVQQTKLNIKEIQEIWRAIRNQTKYRNSLSNSALQIAKQAGWDTELRELENKVTAALAALEDRNFLKRSQNSPQIFANSLLVKNINECSLLISECDSLDDRSKQNCKRVLQRIVKDEECRVDYLAEVLSMKISIAQDSIHQLRNLKILGDTKDLTAFVSLTRSRNGSKQILLRHKKHEAQLLKVLDQGLSKNSYRGLNQLIAEKLGENSSADDIRTLCDYWDRRKLIKKKRIDRANGIYEIILEDKAGLEQEIARRHNVASACCSEIEKLTTWQNSQADRKDDLLTEFSLLELIKDITPFFPGKKPEIKEVERALLYLHHICAIKLEGGFMVIYNRLNVEDIDHSPEKLRFTQEDYQSLKEHYSHKIEQVHIVGEYAKKRLTNYQGSLEYVNDYFSLPMEQFRRKYFYGRGREIKRPVTREKFERLVGDLDTNQMEIHKSKEKNILVLAGPGSGKTKVLVHKIASLLVLEDVKPEQFLMLTFSKSAAMEFKSRVQKLVPEYARLIRIATFHGFCFEKLGQLGNLERSEEVISQCIDAIEGGSIDISSITNKSVLLLDEFQDVNSLEWRLIELIIKKADGIRTIAIGDDDQNIFGFRGASNLYMKQFREKHKARTYSLKRNYRSQGAIVAFNNLLLGTIPSRLKSGSLEAVSNPLNGHVQITEHCSKHLAEPLIQQLLTNTSSGTIAVLTRTNREALMVSTLLKQNGKPALLNIGFEGFRLTDLKEIRAFQEILRKEASDSGLLFRGAWKGAIDHFCSAFSDSVHLDLCLQVFELFEKQMGDRIEFYEWPDYIGQIKTQDVIHAKSDTILVSTMHKSKGKEFDHVFVLHEDFKMDNDDAKRLVYVACSRAKKSLFIHSNIPFFHSFKVPNLRYSISKKILQEPLGFEVLLSHKDVQLESFKYNKMSISALKSGDDLHFASRAFGEQTAFGLSANEQGETILLFSRQYLEKKHQTYQSMGYAIESATVEYLVFWFDKKTNQEYLIVLPKLKYSKSADQ